MRALVLALGIALFCSAVACGGTPQGSHFSGGDDGGTTNPGDDDATVPPGGDDGGACLTCGDGGNPNPGQCTGLQCNAANCSGKTETTLTGHVYDPAGALALYNIYVYVPNTVPDPIIAGNPTCTPCEAPASGSPIIGRQTDANGAFSIAKTSSDPWGVPVGKNIRLVMQAGKWRRQVVVPEIKACQTNDLEALLGKDQLRLPKKSSEGDMPLMAFTSGCDPAECFLRHIGIDDSEFVPPTGNGHVHFYTAYNGPSPIAPGFGGTPASSIAGGNTPADTYTWWSSSANLLKYDIVFNACECNDNARGGSSYGAMHAYLNGGGRLFTTHYYGNWFMPTGSCGSCNGPADFASVAQWSPWNGGSGGMEADAVDQSFPKGMAFAQWLQVNNVSTSLGKISLNDTRDDVTALSGMKGTQWIYVDDASKHPRYLSFNTPVNNTVDKQCGRAVFSDVHLSGASDNSLFPNECANPDAAYQTNEKALEFLFFDLSSCVQDSSKPPPPPPPQ
jgi:hypothetical protein